MWSWCLGFGDGADGSEGSGSCEVVAEVDESSVGGEFGLFCGVGVAVDGFVGVDPPGPAVECCDLEIGAHALVEDLEGSCPAVVVEGPWSEHDVWEGVWEAGVAFDLQDVVDGLEDGLVGSGSGHAILSGLSEFEVDDARCGDGEVW